MSLERLARLAADAEPASLDDLAAHRMVERALTSASLAPARTPTRWLLAPMLACAAVLVAWFALRTSPPPEPALLRVTLPTGDRLVGTQGARFDIDELAPASRRFRVHEGTMLFDVAHVVPAQKFEVATSHVVAIARGTVFSITADAHASHVHVYEGVVEVTQATASLRIEAGESWSSTATPAKDPSRVIEAANEAVRARKHVAVAAPKVTVNPITEPEPTPERSRKSPPPPRTPEPERLDAILARVRAHLAAARFDEALADVRVARSRGASDGAWHLVEGDALRGLGRAGDAAAAFEAAAKSLSGSARAEAAYSAAYLRFHDLRDGPRALTTLDSASVDAEGSSLEERGLALRVQILVALHDDAATIAAKRYLERFPRGGLRAYMTATVRRSASSK